MNAEVKLENRVTVSVIIPVYNVADYLAESLENILAQTLTDFEVICVDDGSTDSSPEILADFARRDSRIQVLRQANAGAGAARNRGLRAARGRYTYFFDADDLCSPELLKRTVARAEETEADIVAFNFSRFYPDGKQVQRIGIHVEWLPKGTEVFNYRDCPNRILGVVNPTPWNKLYRTDFLQEGGFQFEEISSSNDITFAAVTVAAAERVAALLETLFYYRVGHSGTITSQKGSRLSNVLQAVSSALRQVSALPYAEEIAGGARYFAIDNYIFALRNNLVDMTLPISRTYYEAIRSYFLGPEFDQMTLEQLGNRVLYNRFCMVRKHDYDRYCQLRSRRLVVSMTSYPKRIGGVAAVLETIYRQAQLPDEVLLWLAEEQFPNGLADLPEALQKLTAEGKLTVRWCDDLKPHKKYFYAFQQYPEDIIVTIDDDIVYSANMLERLYDSYLLYPEAVSAGRVHLMAVETDGRILPYSNWIKGTDQCLCEPSMQLFATGVLGVLYPPHLLDLSMLDKEAILDTCLFADDLWLKAMELLSDVPVVLARNYESLNFVPKSQETALFHQNVDRNANDVQMQQIIQWVDKRYGAGALEKKLTQSQVGVQLLGIEALCQHMSNERTHMTRERVKVRKDGEKRIQKLQKENTAKDKQIRELKQKLSKAQKANKRLKSSLSYRLGRVLTWPVRKLKGLFRKK